MSTYQVCLAVGIVPCKILTDRTEKAIVDTTTWNKPRTTDELQGFLEHFAGGSKPSKKGKKLSDAPKEKGHPHTLVVAAAGLRAAELTRALRKFQTRDALVAKLFAKHIKLKEAVEKTKSCRMNIGVGTPQRIIDLLDDGILHSLCVFARVTLTVIQVLCLQLSLSESLSMPLTLIKRNEGFWI